MLKSKLREEIRKKIDFNFKVQLLILQSTILAVYKPKSITHYL